uniref:Uncharacterized protein n=1 Tax=Anopheles maculatus TaxID=74869 RepID=A0A182SE47_9DIPT
MLETIVEETSDDDDGRGDKDQGGTQQPLSWSQYDHVWSSGGSDAESVIRVETPTDQDTMSERDFICPPKRRKQETSFGDEFLASDLSAIYGRRPRICEPDGLEPNEYFMKRHNEQRYVKFVGDNPRAESTEKDEIKTASFHSLVDILRAFHGLTYYDSPKTAGRSDSFTSRDL